MAIKKQKPTSPSRRHRSDLDFSSLSKKRPEKSLVTSTIKKKSGRNNAGRITVRHRGGGSKKFLRKIDFNRDKKDVPAKVTSIEYDPNRTANIALLVYQDGEKRYILCPDNLKINDTVISGDKIEPNIGNSLPLKNIPVGTSIHNIELRPGKGGQLVRSAGNSATIQSHENNWTVVSLPSKEARLISSNSFATVGQVSRPEWKTIKFGKAGRKRHMGWRPSVRGVAMHPGAHPHGGGEGRSGIGMKSPKSPWGKRTLGKKTRKKKYSNKYILSDRRSK